LNKKQPTISDPPRHAIHAEVRIRKKGQKREGQELQEKKWGEE